MSADVSLAIVITTIGPPTETVRRICKELHKPLIVIGDNKTPLDWSHDGAAYYSVGRQKLEFPELADLLPYNHYCRKNLGYVIAARQGVQAIVDTDDDNIPLDRWYIPPASGEFDMVPGGEGFVNIYSAFTAQHIWPRGLPLSDILRAGADLRDRSLEKRHSIVGVWQGLANGDPDVDAIYRLTVNKHCMFDSRAPLVLGKGTLSPYNSQNTVTFRAFFPLLYLPCHVSFRFTDILRGLIGQIILWNHGASLGFFEATVFQDRNEHDLYGDFLDEMPCYVHVNEVVETVVHHVKPMDSVSNQLVDAYEALERKGIVQAAELPILTTWLRAL